MFLETYDFDEYGDNTFIKLKDIPKEFQINLEGKSKEYQFLGAIQIQTSVSRTTRKKDLIENFVGTAGFVHYIPIMQRSDGSYIRIDGLGSEPIKVEKLKANFTFIPAILVYFCKNA